jgi:hypothetical protein
VPEDLFQSVRRVTPEPACHGSQQVDIHASLRRLMSRARIRSEWSSLTSAAAAQVLGAPPRRAELGDQLIVLEECFESL